jgi:hypothetical protein
VLLVSHLLCRRTVQCIESSHTTHLVVTFLSSRLHVYGVDFRNLTALEWFCSYVIANYDRLDAIVNNAAQTVRRPPAYYAHLVEGERMLTYTAGFDDDSSSSNSSGNGSCSSSSSGGAGPGSTPSSGEPSHSSECTSELDIDSAGTERVRSVLRHQQRYSSSLSAAVEAAEGTGAGSGAGERTHRIEEIGGDRNRSTGLATDTRSVTGAGTGTGAGIGTGTATGAGTGTGTGTGAGAGVDIEGEAESVVLSDREASYVTVSGPPKTRDIQMTPAISSSEMTQLILAKVQGPSQGSSSAVTQSPLLSSPLLSSPLLFCPV